MNVRWESSLVLVLVCGAVLGAGCASEDVTADDSASFVGVAATTLGRDLPPGMTRETHGRSTEVHVSRRHFRARGRFDGGVFERDSRTFRGAVGTDTCARVVGELSSRLWSPLQEAGLQPGVDWDGTLTCYDDATSGDLQVTSYFLGAAPPALRDAFHRIVRGLDGDDVQGLRVDFPRILEAEGHVTMTVYGGEPDYAQVFQGDFVTGTYPTLGAWRDSVVTLATYACSWELESCVPEAVSSASELRAYLRTIVPPASWAALSASLHGGYGFTWEPASKLKLEGHRFEFVSDEGLVRYCSDGFACE